MRRSGTLTSRCFAAAWLAAVATAAPGGADWRRFLPTPVDHGAEIDLLGSVESEEILAGDRVSQWSDTFTRQKLGLFTNGYVYHPRFLQYRLALGGAYKQEEYDSSGFGRTVDASRDGSSLEYDVRLVLLPEHSYNLQLFASRYEPLFRERGAAQRTTVDTLRGIEAGYRRKPWLGRARVSERSVERGEARSDVLSAALSGEYLRELGGDRVMSVTAAFDPSRFDGSDGVEGETRTAWAQSWVDLDRFTLRSRLHHETRSQSGGGVGSFEADSFTWEERLTVPLPHRFRAELGYRLREDDTTSRRAGAVRANHVSASRQDVDLELSHRLYESLESRYRIRKSDAESREGNTGWLLQALDLTYGKRIPRGRVVAGVAVSRTDTDSRGTVATLDERHPAVAVPGLFRLSGRNVDLATLVVFLRSPLPPFELVELFADVHYRVAVIGDEVEVVVFRLPERFAPNGTYEIQVSYRSGGSFELRSDSLGWNLSVQLFDDLLTPYASHRELRSEVLAGTFPGSALDATTDVLGVSLQRRGFRLRLEYQDVRWDVGPYEAWLLDAHYTASFRSGTRVSATVSHLERDYHRGRTGALATPYEEEIESAGLSLQQSLFDRALSLSVAGSWSRLTGIVEHEAWTLSSSLTWKVGDLDVAGGYSLTEADSESLTTGRGRRIAESYHLRVRRTLF